ncbi:hypothetical protein KM472_gp078 [Cynomolgus macaque cytomegalovirus strain Ottawa]|uniref:Uncharacterized protein n=1 Tax=macacine betaherpesvirus 8 TaxID=2560567 RepID=G8H181_9BETA|nr:hypothetical protein KM472_gp078 [Cynomolgus macaque cytomegalovirus strain Ottawa]AEQ32155.1 hypothetical protein cy75 [Cynomolgus macaque cytomegalovirus strain Ottawa]
MPRCTSATPSMMWSCFSPTSARAWEIFIMTRCLCTCLTCPSTRYQKRTLTASLFRRFETQTSRCPHPAHHQDLPSRRSRAYRLQNPHPRKHPRKENQAPAPPTAAKRRPRSSKTRVPPRLVCLRPPLTIV